MVGYISSNSKLSLNEVLMFKGRFEVMYGFSETGYQDGIRIVTLRRNFIFKTGSVAKRDD